jgi:hypothetical protein
VVEAYLLGKKPPLPAPPELRLVQAAEAEGAAGQWHRYSIQPAMGDGDDDRGDEEPEPGSHVEAATRTSEQ